MARPSKLTPEVSAAIGAAVAESVPLARAAEAQGVHRDTAYRWRRDGQREDGDPACRAFAEAIADAEARSCVGLVRIIRESAPKDWRAAAWLLARREPELFPGESRVRVSGDPDGEPVRLSMDDLGPALDRVIADALALVRPNRDGSAEAA